MNNKYLGEVGLLYSIVQYSTVVQYIDINLQSIACDVVMWHVSHQTPRPNPDTSQYCHADTLTCFTTLYIPPCADFILFSKFNPWFILAEQSQQFLFLDYFFKKLIPILDL